jgi:hypothetical protein
MFWETDDSPSATFGITRRALDPVAERATPLPLKRVAGGWGRHPTKQRIQLLF